MIEVEQHFVIDAAARERLIADAVLVGEIKNHDIYYDTSTYALTTKDVWLRQRNGQFELKVGCNNGVPCDSGRAVRYEELEDEVSIRERLGIRGAGALIEDLAPAGYVPYGEWVITRTTYRKGDFKVDFDTLDYGYELVEIELMVEKPDEVAVAAERVAEFAREHGLVVQYVRGKNSEYLRRYSKAHFNALVAAGIIPPEPAR